MSLASARLPRMLRTSLRSTFTPRLRPFVPRTPLHSVRHASTTSEASSIVVRLKNFFFGTSIFLFGAFGYLYVTDTRAGVHQWLLVPVLRWVYPDAEDAHHYGTKTLKALHAFGLNPRERKSPVDLSVEVFGQTLQCPIGTSAGIDKLAEIPDALFALGPSIVEVGGATPHPQNGNPRPRVFRLPEQKALINRYGLNSEGADDMAMRLRERVRTYAYRNGFGFDEAAEKFVLDGGAGVPPGSLIDGKMLAVQVAKNKFTKDEDIEAVKQDYIYCVERLAPYADIMVVNVSSPNTPGLRSLQRVEPLTKILEGVVGAAKLTARRTKPKVMVKVSPDEDEDEQMEGIVEAIWRSGVDGVIVGNTTKRRHIPDHIGLTAKERQILDEQGGLSGPHMFERTLGLVKRYRSLLDKGPSEEKSSKAVTGVASRDELRATIAEKIESVKDTFTGSRPEQKVIFATGGITNGKQALEILNAGANIAQVYTALIYGGSGTITRMKMEMKDEITRKQ